MEISLIQKVFERIEGSVDLVVHIQRELVRRPAISPQNGGLGEREKMNYIRELLENLSPFHVVQIDAPDRRADG
ncbi:MAG: M20 family metallo-hydrolase, partial [Desulfatiglandales bacterium]